MTDLEAFVEFFTMKGVEFDSYDASATKEFVVLEVGDTGFRFDLEGKFLGIIDYETTLFSERIPAPDE